MGTLVSVGGNFWAAYKPLIIAFAIMAVLAFVLLQLLVVLRRRAEQELQQLYYSDVALYLERLENNKRLKYVFRAPIILLYRLDGYLKLGSDEKIREVISTLDSMKLEPRDRVEFLQKRMSFFVSVGEAAEARASFDRLSDYLHTVKADEVDQYRAMIDEGKEIIRVYLDKDVTYMNSLLKKAEKTQHPVLRGVIYYRLAKLAHFKGDADKREKYLRQASQTLGGTDYEAIIAQALIAPDILETK